jgi:hypothetical protein
MLAASAMTSMSAPRLQADLPTPWLGVWERVNLAAWLLWVAVLSAKLRGWRSRSPSKLACDLCP